MKQASCKLCGKAFICDNGMWLTTCTCAKDRSEELKKAQEKFDRECPDTAAITNLQPGPAAPWEAVGFMVVDANGVDVCECDAHELCVRIAMEHNAFDVMMRRGWWPEFFGPIAGWSVASDCLQPFVSKAISFVRWCDEQRWHDPFTALVEADQWYRENVELTPPSSPPPIAPDTTPSISPTD